VCTRRGGEVTASSSDGSVFTARIPVGASLVDA
jgi:two-component system, CitB family, sensor kinase